MPAHPKEPIITAKITIPVAPVSSVTRAYLGEIVEMAADKRLVLVCAPAGYGKTILMSQWAQLLQENDEELAWLTLDKADNDPGRLYYYLDLILNASNLQDISGAEVNPDRIRGVSAAHASLLAAIVQRSRAPLTIFIDDFEVIGNKECHSLFEMLLSQLPSGVRLVVATRTMPSWKLAKLKVAGSLLEIGVDHLRLQPSEIDELHLFPLAQTVSDTVFDRIVSVMEGWAAGVQLALLATQEQLNPERFVEQILGRTEDINSFLSEEVFNSLEQAEQNFLLFTGILERFCGPLCEALTENKHGGETIDKMARKGLFIQSLDSHGEWYRYHNIFKTFLQDNLLKQNADRVNRLHAIAANWFSDNGYYEEGVHHALSAGNPELAAELLSKCIRTMVEHGQLETVEGYVSQLEPAQVGKHPEIIGGAAWAYTFLRRFNKLEDILERKEFSANADVQTLKPLLAIFQDDLPLAYEQAKSNLEQVPETMAFNRGVLFNIIAYCLVARSRFEEATAQVARGKTYHSEAHSVFGQAYSEVIEALVDRAKGDLKAALRKLERVENNEVAKSVAVGFHAELLYMMNRVQEAEQLLQSYFQLAVKNAPPDFVTLAYLVRARIAFVKKRYHRAYSIVEEGQHVSEHWPLPHMQRIMNWERVRFALLRGEIDAALKFAPKAEDGTVVYQTQGDYLRLSDETTSEDIAALRLQIYVDPSFKLLAIIKKEITLAQQNKRQWRALQLQILYAIAHQAVNEEELALRAMNDALVMGGQIGTVRTFLDEGERARDLLCKLGKDRLDEDRQHPDTKEQVDYLCKVIGEEYQDLLNRFTTTAASTITQAGLTKREQQILGLLSQGLSNEQIGQRAYLSINTVKWHLKRIYQKLGVKSRVEASAVVRQIPGANGNS